MINTTTTSGFILMIAIAFILMFGLVFVLQTLPPRGRRIVVILFTFFAGLFFAAEFFLPVRGEDKENFLSPRVLEAQQFLQIIGSLALGLGTYGLLRIHTRNVVQQRIQWGYSLVLLVSLFTMGFLSIYNTFAEKGVLPEKAWVKTPFDILFQNTLVQLDAAMFSLIAFYIFSAAYRAFRIRSIEASILMFTAMIVMLGVVPIGAFISEQIFRLPIELPPEYAKEPFSPQAILYSLKLPTIADWILKTLNSPAQRAIEFGIGVGGLAMSIRLWLSLERGVGVER
jgi:hypothetical protein